MERKVPTASPIHSSNVANSPPAPVVSDPAQAVTRDLGVREGDILYAVRTPNGVELMRYDPEFEWALDDGSGAEPEVRYWLAETRSVL